LEDKAKGDTWHGGPQNSHNPSAFADTEAARTDATGSIQDL